MLKDDETRLWHMLDAAREALSFARRRTGDDLDCDRQLVPALIKDIEIVGEAAAQASEPGRRDVPEMPRQSIVGMCNRLVHAYFDVNLDIVWKTVREDLPEPIVLREKAISVHPDLPRRWDHDLSEHQSVDLEFTN